MSNEANSSSDVKLLSQCKRNEKVTVVRLNADSALKQRLISFGIMKEAVVEILEHAPAKSTIEVKVGKMRIALRAQEADLIEVKSI